MLTVFVRGHGAVKELERGAAGVVLGADPERKARVGGSEGE